MFYMTRPPNMDTQQKGHRGTMISIMPIMRQTYIRVVLWSIAAVILRLSLPGLLDAADPGNGMQITRHKVEGSRFDKFRGVAHISTSVQAVKELISDSDSYTQWLHQCQKVNVVNGDLGGGKAYIYFIYKAPKLPWYLSFAPRPRDRDMVLQLVWEEDDVTRKVTVTLASVNPQEETDLRDVPIPDDPSLTTVRKVSILWEFIPEENDRIKVIHEMYIDPNHQGHDMGIMNRYTKNLVEQTLKNVCDRLSEVGS